MRAITWDDLIVSSKYVDDPELFADWNWLFSGRIKPLLVTRFGDMFFHREDEKTVYFLDTVEGDVFDIGIPVDNFEVFINQPDNIEQFLLSSLVHELIHIKPIQRPDQCYTFIIPPMLGGKMEPDNVQIMDIKVAVSLTGQIIRQVKFLPEGTRITKFRVSSEEEN